MQHTISLFFNYEPHPCIIFNRNIKELIRETVYKCKLGGSTTASTHDIPQPLCSAREHPNKETAIQEYKS